jgi:hypothetical protein
MILLAEKEQCNESNERTYGVTLKRKLPGLGLILFCGVGASEPAVNVLINPDEKYCMPTEKWLKEFSQIHKRVKAKINSFDSKTDGEVTKIVTNSASVFSGGYAYAQSIFNLKTNELKYTISLYDSFQSDSSISKNTYDLYRTLIISSGNNIEKIPGKLSSSSSPCFYEKLAGQMRISGVWCPHQHSVSYELSRSQLEFLSNATNAPIWLRTETENGGLSRCGLLMSTQEIKGVVTATKARLKELGKQASE